MASHHDGPWRTKGVPFYLVGQGARLGLPPAAVEHPRVKDNRQLSKIAGHLGALQREYYNAPQHGDDRSFSPIQMAAIAGLLETAEGEVGKLHAIAAAGSAMVAEAYDAFGLPEPARNFAVVVASESPAESVEDATPPAIVAEEIASLRSEVERLRAENEALSEKLTAPAVEAAPISPPPNPIQRRQPARA